MFLLLTSMCNWSASSLRRTQSPTSVCCVSWRTPTLALRAKGLIKCLNDLLRDMIMRMGKQFVLISNNCSVYLGYVSTDLGRVWLRESLVMWGRGKKGEVSCYFFFFLKLQVYHFLTIRSYIRKISPTRLPKYQQHKEKNNGFHYEQRESTISQRRDKLKTVPNPVTLPFIHRSTQSRLRC